MLFFELQESHDLQSQIHKLLMDQRSHSHVVNSNFSVTAVGRINYQGKDLYCVSSNGEYLNHRTSTHGEEGVMAIMHTALGKSAQLTGLWVMGGVIGTQPGSEAANLLVTCCGKCRQQICSCANADVPVTSVSINGNVQQTTVGEFLPQSFGFKDFDVKDLQPSRLNYSSFSVADLEKRVVCQGVALSDAEIFDWLNSLEAVDHANKKEEMVVIQVAENTYVAGVSIQEAAYISINAMQAALSNARTAFGEFEVQRVWSRTKDNGLTESASSTISFPAPAMISQFEAFKNSANTISQRFSPLNGSSLEALREFSTNTNAPITLFNDNGLTATYSFNNAARFIPSSKKQTFTQDEISRVGMIEPTRHYGRTKLN